MKTKIILITTLILLPVFYSSSQEFSGDKMQVVGKAIIESVPENIQIRIPVKMVDSSFVICSDKLVVKLKNLQKELENIGIKTDHIKTLNFSVNENFVYKEKERKREGYVGTANMQITDIYSSKLLGNTLEVLKQIEMPYSIGFDLSDRQRENLTESAIQKAVQDAKNKAGLLALASGVELKRITRIAYDYGHIDYDLTTMIEKEREEDVFYNMGNDLKLSPKEVKIEKKVIIEWQVQSK
ncbi:MAG: SIMPL domain-containing protein [Mangrovibacterium sp.]